MVRATGTAPVCSCSRSRRLTFRLRSDKLPSALNPASGHYFDRARSLPAHQVQLGKRKWSSIRVLRPVFRFGRPACISQHLCSEKMESRVRVALTREVLRTTAWAARPTGPSNGEWGMQDAECRCWLPSAPPSTTALMTTNVIGENRRLLQFRRFCRPRSGLSPDNVVGLYSIAGSSKYPGYEM